MKIIFDLQACQSNSSFRGIGRYSYSLAYHIIKDAISRGHEVYIFLNSNMSLNVMYKLLDLNSNLSIDNFILFKSLCPSSDNNPLNIWRNYASQLLREYYLLKFNPDFIHVSSLLAEGWSNNTCISINKYFKIPTALTHYDLIPLVMPNEYLPTLDLKNIYFEKLSNLKRADLIFTTSEYSKNEIKLFLNNNFSELINISGSFFIDLKKSFNIDKINVLNKFNIRPNFLLSAPGGFDYRKNILGLIQAYACLPFELRSKHQLVITSSISDEHRKFFDDIVINSGLSAGDVVFTDYIDDSVLQVLYTSCYLYIFPSLMEGFGLPILEAYFYGVPVIASNSSSIPELVDFPEAMFDPKSIEDISKCMFKALTDSSYLLKLRSHSSIQINKFNWVDTSCIALDAIENTHFQTNKNIHSISTNNNFSAIDLLNKLSNLFQHIQPEFSDIDYFYDCYDNLKYHK